MHNYRYFLGMSAMAATVAAALVGALEVSVAALPSQDDGIHRMVDRSNKGDRLTTPSAMGVPTQQPSLPQGCVAAMGWHKASIYDGEIPGRCVA